MILILAGFVIRFDLDQSHVPHDGMLMLEGVPEFWSLFKM